MQSVRLEYGRLVKSSVRGEKGFYYPSDNLIPISNSCVAEPMPGWQRYGGLVAYKIPTECVRNKHKYNSHSKYMVIWLEAPAGD